ncbi:hypothetical protein [Leptospira alexanderi]|uniref:Uncharacterized protein n=1 Tax=Leptospira alexanderi serovar Manhao 3 str. L 60 TaxID=1049759 RepID=V6HWJ5_9LEPT|nr:hypothetical protein [Leptospira alexanderi]EQA61821.1 hypothetical protein LEP1GSC062_3244 [Leptospira alexanderi serovar Manhao 3 str. L 60]
MPETPFDFDGKYIPSGDVRHVIDWSGYSGEVKIPDSLKIFYGFLEEPEKRRISFIVQAGSVYREQFTVKIYSKDPQIPEFNKIFSQSNIQIPKFSNSVRTYDYDTKGTNIPGIPERVKKETEEFLKDAKNIILVGLGAFITWQIFKDDLLGRGK